MVQSSRSPLQRVTDAAAQTMQSYRPASPFTETEKALSLAAFNYWIQKGKQDPNPMFFIAANDSARLFAIDFMDRIYNKAEVLVVLNKAVPGFNPQAEIRLARERSNNPEWKISLSRALIMLTRGLAYTYTEHRGVDTQRRRLFSFKRSETLDAFGADVLNVESSAWLEAQLGETPARAIMGVIQRA